MANVKNNCSAQETRRKLLDAAGEIFAERGFHAATTKQITDRAGVNSAAINYHFSDKTELYAAVVRYALSLTPRPDAEAKGSAEQRLRAFIADVIEDLYDPGRPAWCTGLLAREFSQPTAGLTAVIDELIRPRAAVVNGIVRDFLGPGAREDQVIRAGISIASQCFFYLYHGKLLRRMHPELLGEDQKEAIVEHIAQFSLSGLKAMRDAIGQAGQTGEKTLVFR